MYSTKEKLNYHRQLSNPLAAEADLALLHEKSPQGTDFTRFDLAPQKNAEDILFALLDVGTHDEIVRNRREFFAKQKDDEDNDSTPTDTDDETVDNPVDNPMDNSEEDSNTGNSDKVPAENADAEPTEQVLSATPADEAPKQEQTAQEPATEKKRRSPKKKSTPK